MKKVATGLLTQSSVNV